MRTKVEDHAHLHILILRESRLKTVHGSGSRKRGFTKSARESLASPPRRPATRALWALADAAFGHSEAACDERARAHAGIYARFGLTETGTRFALHFGETHLHLLPFFFSLEVFLRLCVITSSRRRSPEGRRWCAARTARGRSRVHREPDNRVEPICSD